MSDSESTVVSFRRAPGGVRRLRLDDFARQLSEQAAAGRTFDCLIADDREMRRLNRQFRGKDYPTDVLSFPVMRRGDAASLRRGDQTLGSIAISHERAKEQAAERGHALADELRILMLHGVLHLLGFDHEIDGGRMARAEARWRGHFGLPDNLIARAHR